MIDTGKRKGLKVGRFLILGPASLDLLKQSGESLEHLMFNNGHARLL